LIISSFSLTPVLNVGSDGSVVVGSTISFSQLSNISGVHLVWNRNVAGVYLTGSSYMFLPAMMQHNGNWSLGITQLTDFHLNGGNCHNLSSVATTEVLNVNTTAFGCTNACPSFGPVHNDTLIGFATVNTFVNNAVTYKNCSCRFGITTQSPICALEGRTFIANVTDSTGAYGVSVSNNTCDVTSIYSPVCASCGTVSILTAPCVCAYYGTYFGRTFCLNQNQVPGANITTPVLVVTEAIGVNVTQLNNGYVDYSLSWTFPYVIPNCELSVGLNPGGLFPFSVVDSACTIGVIFVQEDGTQSAQGVYTFSDIESHLSHFGFIQYLGIDTTIYVTTHYVGTQVLSVSNGYSYEVSAIPHC